MTQFAQAFPEEAIVVTLSQQLSWSHFHALLPIKDPLARDFYAEMCRIDGWGVRKLRQKIGGMLFRRTALSKRPTSVISAEIGKLRDGQKSPHFGSLSRVARPLAQQNLGHASLAKTTVYGSTEAKRRMKAVSAFWAGKR